MPDTVIYHFCGGEENDCDNGGEVVWQGGTGGTHGSGTSGYPAIY